MCEATGLGGPGVGDIIPENFFEILSAKFCVLALWTAPAPRKLGSSRWPGLPCSDARVHRQTNKQTAVKTEPPLKWWRKQVGIRWISFRNKNCNYRLTSNTNATGKIR